MGNIYITKLSNLLFKIIYLVVYSWPCWAFVAAQTFFSPVAVHGLLIAVASLVADRRP